MSVLSRPQCVNLLANGKCGYDSECVILKQNLGTDILSTSSEHCPEDLSPGKPTSAQVLAWCCEAVSYPDSKVHGANMGPICGRQDPGGTHVGTTNLAIWVVPEPMLTKSSDAIWHHKATIIQYQLCDTFNHHDDIGRSGVPCMRVDCIQVTIAYNSYTHSLIITVTS